MNPELLVTLIWWKRTRHRPIKIWYRQHCCTSWLGLLASLPLSCWFWVQPQIAMHGGFRFMQHQHPQYSPLPLFSAVLGRKLFRLLLLEYSSRLAADRHLMNRYGNKIPYALGSWTGGTEYPALVFIRKRRWAVVSSWRLIVTVYVLGGCVCSSVHQILQSDLARPPSTS
jgi:hypothetical protein